MNISDFIRVYDDIIPGDVCDSLIELFESRTPEVHDTPGYKFHQVNLMAGDDITPGVDLVQRVIPLIDLYMQDVGFYGNPLPLTHFEDVRIKRYTPGGEFKMHVDVNDHASARRALIFIVYLNDNDGDTFFPHGGVRIQPKKGRVAIFPPFWMFPHSGTPPTTTKYIAMSAVHYT